MNMAKKILNVIKFSTSLSNLQVLLRKILEKVSEIGRDESEFAFQWANKKQVPIDIWLQSMEGNLYLETIVAVETIRKQSQETIKELQNSGIDLGGGGAIDLLYFFTRLIQPRRILETGVAAGWSSFAFLLAIERNKTGVLLSSDLPYFRIANPERYIGILVPEKYRSDNWQLEMKGDQFNLPKLLDISKKLELVHYDSDKRKASRIAFLNTIEKFIADDAIVIMDDIQNNLAFRDFVVASKLTYTVVKSEEKFVGVILFGKYRNLILNLQSLHDKAGQSD
jgi:predicted O-methyltransferase YrrM